MSGARSTHGRHEKCIEFHSENLKIRDYLDKLSLDGRIILKWVLNIIGSCILDTFDSR
jgi:hypothetical protein